MRFPLFRRRTVWVPTWFGLLCFAVVFGGVIAWWCFGAEAFLSTSNPEEADVLVVEGWIDALGVQAAAQLYRFGGYHYIVATGGQTGKVWDTQRWDYAKEAAEQLIRLKIPHEEVIQASARHKEAQRTYEMAAASWRALHNAGIHPKGINVFTRSTHARRSRLVFSKVFGGDVPVGVIAWKPPGFEQEKWWQSSERADDMIKESIGYVFELLFNSGRGSNSPELPP
jgi:uncharacterized SAM-binding protein YcdF (DUF218 family)